MYRLVISLAWLACLEPYAAWAAVSEPATLSTRTLAASCAACHGPDGNSAGGTPTLAALNQQYFIQRMHAFKDGSVSATVMHHHAKGLTMDEVTALAAYFAQQPRQTPQHAPHQSFRGAQ